MRRLLWSVKPLISSLVHMWTDVDVEQGGIPTHSRQCTDRFAWVGALPLIAPLSLLDFRLAVWGR